MMLLRRLKLREDPHPTRNSLLVLTLSRIGLGNSNVDEVVLENARQLLNGKHCVNEEQMAQVRCPAYPSVPVTPFIWVNILPS